MAKLILASASPRRQELIRLLGLPYEVQVANVDEESVNYPDPAANAVQVATLKAETIAAQIKEEAVIVAADTTVVLEAQMLGKPVDEADALAMLQRLRGRVHQVHTGIVIINTATGQNVAEVATVEVSMRHYSDDEVRAYVTTGDPLDKAGAYAIQHPEFQPVRRIVGCYMAVVGLPLCHLTRMLRQVGVAVTKDVAALCQPFQPDGCRVYQFMMAG